MEANNKKIRFKDIFIYSASKFDSVFELFTLSFWKFIIYFLILNLLMMIPISIGIIRMENPDYSRYGLDFADTVPEWIPSGLPQSCVIENARLDCDTDVGFEYEITNNDTVYTIYLNSTGPLDASDFKNAIVFQKDVFHFYFSDGSVMEFDYSGFDYLNFADLHDMTPEDASAILYEGVFQSLKPAIILPLMLYTNGILLLTNLLLIIALASLSMLFKFTQTGFIKYKDMIKLMIIASTFPSLVNLALNSFGMSAFTSISYNYATPIIAFFIYRANKAKEIDNY
ncbi:MAG: DUF1189 family protein [Candidatus Izemoplasma sp.]